MFILTEIGSIAKLLEKGEVNPRDIKMLLARDIISLYHSQEELKEAENNFAALYQKKNIEVELPIIEYNLESADENGMYSVIECIFSTGKYKSKSEVRRLIQQGAVKINGEKTQDLLFVPENDMVISVGKGNTFKLMSSENKLDKVLKKIKKVLLY